jgi:hypothetical protein
MEKDHMVTHVIHSMPEFNFSALAAASNNGKRKRPAAAAAVAPP